MLDIMSNQADLMELADFMDDPDLSAAIEQVIRLILKPETEDLRKVPRFIVLFQAWSAKFALLGTQYSTIKKDRAGTDSNFKKNIYKTAADNMDKIAAALKYLVK